MAETDETGIAKHDVDRDRGQSIDRNPAGKAEDGLIAEGDERYDQHGSGEHSEDSVMEDVFGHRGFPKMPNGRQIRVSAIRK